MKAEKFKGYSTGKSLESNPRPSHSQSFLPSFPSSVKIDGFRSLSNGVFNLCPSAVSPREL